MSMQPQTLTKAASTPSPSYTPIRTGLLQRTCACGAPGVYGECAECRSKRLSVQPRGLNAANPSTVASPPIVHDVLRSPGQPLDADTRNLMEPRFGHDFSRVRMHAAVPGIMQTKLTINRPGDKYEQEADQVAEQVMRCRNREFHGLKSYIGNQGTILFNKE